MSKKANKKSKGLKTDFESVISIGVSKSGKSILTVDQPVKFLSTASIPIFQENDVKLAEKLQVPPTTPRDLVSDCEVTSVPQNLPKITTIPWVREIGVKETIKKLSDIYGCEQFNWNLTQFWFLDFVTDCLWRLQDEYQFAENHQKVILQWILYVFNLIRAPDLDLTRKQTLKIFSEAISAAEHYIENGSTSVPLPEELFVLNMGELKRPTNIGDQHTAQEDAESGSGSCSLSTSSDVDEPQAQDSYLAIECRDGLKFFDLPPKLCPWDTDEDCLSTSIETASEDEMIFVKRESTHGISDEETEVNADLMFEDFYKPDLRTPPRFKASSESIFDDISSISNSDESFSIEVEEEEETAKSAPNWFIAKRKYPDVPCPSKIFEVESEGTSGVDEKKKEEEALQSWFDYHLWQLRKADMDDPTKGWLAPSEIESESVETISLSEDSATVLAQRKLFEYIMESKEKLKEARKNYFINSCAIMAIKKLVRDCFFGRFQFSLLKTAYRYPQYLITQELNKIWYVPKKFKGEIKRPKPRKQKKEKVKKEKKPKKEKGSKKSTKSSKKGSKKDSKKSKSSKDSKKSKKKGKEKKEKKPGMTKQEKAELARLQAEIKLREEMERKAEENRLFVFPLTDAAEDNFFENIFTNWVKPKKGKGEKKAKAGKEANKKPKKK